MEAAEAVQEDTAAEAVQEEAAEVIQAPEEAVLAEVQALADIQVMEEDQDRVDQDMADLDRIIITIITDRARDLPDIIPAEGVSVAVV